MNKKVIAIVGKPNVGKSTLFNRLIQSQNSIVNKQSGVTRDRIYGEFEWKNNHYILIDTGGIQIEDATLQEEINIQATLAMEEAEIILFVVDQQTGMGNDENYIAKLLKKYSNKPIIICANKTDTPNDIYEHNHTWEKLGYKNIFYICTSNGINIGDLLNYIAKNFPSLSQENNLYKTTFALVGKPNVGKSSLINTLFNEYKIIVSDMPGTTRDPIYLDLHYNNETYKIVDTAGIKKINKLYDKVDQISLLKTKLAIEHSKIICQVFDGSLPITNMDLNISKLIQDSTKPFIIIINKMDLMKEADKKHFLKSINYEMNFCHNVQILFTSTITKKNINNIFIYLQNIINECKRKWDFDVLNKYMNNLELMKPPSLVSSRRVKIYEIKQVNREWQIPIFQILVDDTKYFPDNYLKFLINKFEEYLKIKYTPLKIIVKNK